MPRSISLLTSAGKTFSKNHLALDSSPKTDVKNAWKSYCTSTPPKSKTIFLIIVMEFVG